MRKIKNEIIFNEKKKIIKYKKFLNLYNYYNFNLIFFSSSLIILLIDFNIIIFFNNYFI